MDDRLTDFIGNIVTGSITSIPKEYLNKSALEKIAEFISIKDLIKLALFDKNHQLKIIPLLPHLIKYILYDESFKEILACLVYDKNITNYQMQLIQGAFNNNRVNYERIESILGFNYKNKINFEKAKTDLIYLSEIVDGLSRLDKIDYRAEYITSRITSLKNLSDAKYYISEIFYGPQTVKNNRIKIANHLHHYYNIDKNFNNISIEQIQLILDIYDKVFLGGFLNKLKQIGKTIKIKFMNSKKGAACVTMSRQTPNIYTLNISTYFLDKFSLKPGQSVTGGDANHLVSSKLEYILQIIEHEIAHIMKNSFGITKGELHHGPDYQKLALIFNQTIFKDYSNIIQDDLTKLYKLSDFKPGEKVYVKTQSGKITEYIVIKTLKKNVLVKDSNGKRWYVNPLSLSKNK